MGLVSSFVSWKQIINLFSELMKKTSTPDILMYLFEKEYDTKRDNSRSNMPGPGRMAVNNILNYSRSVAVFNTRSAGNVIQILN